MNSITKIYFIVSFAILLVGCITFIIAYLISTLIKAEIKDVLLFMYFVYWIDTAWNKSVKRQAKKLLKLNKS